MRYSIDGWVLRAISVTALALGTATACGSDDSELRQNAGVGGQTNDAAAGGTGGMGGSEDAGSSDADAASYVADDVDLAFLETIALVQKTIADHPNIWPGYQFSDVALYGVDSGRRQLAVHSAVTGHPVLSGIPAATSGTLGPVYVVDGLLDFFDDDQGFARYELPGDAVGFALAFPFGKHVIGQTLPPSQEQSLLATVSVHEVFHLHQDQWSLDYQTTECGFPLDDDTLGWGWIEHLALAEAVKGPTSLDRLRDAMIARLARNAAEPSIVDVEDHWEAIEGSAKFVDLSMSEKAGLQPSVGTTLEYSLPGAVAIDGFGRNRHYLTGAALMYVLDRNGKSFRSELESGERLHQIASDAVNLDTATAEAELPAVLAKYQYDTQVLPGIQSARDAYVAERDALVQAFASPAGRIVRLALPPKSLETFSYEKGYELDDCMNYYGQASIWFDMPKLSGSATNQAALRTNATYDVWELVSANEPSFELDGATVAFENGSHSFTKLDVKTPSWELHSELPGTIVISDTEVSIAIAE